MTATSLPRLAYRRLSSRAGLLAVALLAGLPYRSLGEDPPSFVLFESGQVRPIALSPSGDRLFVANTPDNRLEVLAIEGGRLRHLTSAPVGLEPVAVAARSSTEVWVVNHLSDSISVVEIGEQGARVVRTLLVGDEPRDLLFAGPGRSRAFVTTAHRGQHRTHPSIAHVPGAGDPRHTQAGVGRADVWVFDTGDLGDAMGGVPLRIVELFGDTPRGLAASPDGGTVYAAVFFSGNQTTVVGAEAVCDGFSPTDLEDACPDEHAGSPGGNPGPATNHQGEPAPEVGLIVKLDRESGEWRDELGRDWSHAIRFDLPDLDVFAIDAATLEQTAAYRHVGTTLLNLAVNPATGVLYVSNTEARNEVRFEGPGRFGGSTVQGHLAESQVTVITPTAVTPRHLNPHIDYRQLPAPPSVRRHSLATPLDMAVSADGETLYVAAFGSSRVGVISTRELESGDFDPRQASAGYLTVSGGGPSGLALDQARGLLFVLTRFDNAVSVLDLESRQEIQHLPLYNPEPEAVVDGRPFLYDAELTSSNGEASCSSCHIFGDFDGLAWDLGDPDGDVTQSPIPITLGSVAELLVPGINGTGNVEDFHPMKGPMTTQTLRGLVNAGAMHWRGDRSTGIFGTAPFDTDLSFRNFNVAFEGLVGRADMLTPGEMQRFTDFALEITLPPNPIRSLDNSLTPSQRRGQRFYNGPRRADGLPAPSPLGNTCEDCHTLKQRDGHFGTNGEQSFEAESQIFKVPHLRNLYQKVGMFGMAESELILPGDHSHQGEQIRGFGFLHDGVIDTLFRFFSAQVFEDSSGGLVGFRNDQERRDMEAFTLAFPSDLAPIVGQQITLTAANRAAADPRIDLLVARAGAPFTSKMLGGEVTECDLVVKGWLEDESRGLLYDPVSGRFLSDRRAEAPLSDAELRARASTGGQELTYSCVPPGSGRRIALDRDEDGHFDRDELDAGTDPADAGSFPTNCAAGGETLCLLGGRFAVEVEWRDFENQAGRGQVVSASTDQSGLFWFFDPQNWEMLVKMVDGCSGNDRFWVFAAATTNVEYTLTVRDTVTNASRTYGNVLGTSATAVTDTDAFSTCGAE